MNNEICRRCGGQMDFTGLDRQRRRVVCCTRNLTARTNDGVPTMVRCAPEDEVQIAGALLRRGQVAWFPRTTDKWLR